MDFFIWTYFIVFSVLFELVVICSDRASSLFLITAKVFTGVEIQYVTSFFLSIKNMILVVPHFVSRHSFSVF